MSSTIDIYDAPEADLYDAPHSGEYGSIEKGLAGDYEFSIGAIYSEAWSKVSGNKMLVFGISLVYIAIMVIYVAAMGITEALFGMEGPQEGVTLNPAGFPIDLIYYGVYGVMTVGSTVIGAKLSMGLPTGINDLFRFANRFLRALLTYILMIIMIVIGFLLLVIPGIYLSVAYMHALPLALEKGLSPWQALETSRKAISKRWFAFLGYMMVNGIIALGGILTLGIGFIWLAPLLIIAFGITYRNIFGLSPETLAS